MGARHYKTRSFRVVVAATLLALANFTPLPAAAAPPPPPPTTAPADVTITVAPGERQTFAGFGAGLGNWGREYQKLAPAERERLSSLLWRGLRMRSLRLWINLNEYAPTPGARLTKDFRERYVDSGLIADAKRFGVVDLLLAPDNAPPHMKVKRDGGPQDFALREESLADYAALIAGFIEQVRDETGLLINVTGVQNEPNDLDRIAPAQMPKVVAALRADLDRRGLRDVRIIAPEAANVDGVFYDTLDRLRADPAAWAALAGVASHSYGMGATADAVKRLADPAGGKGFKDYWMTEASDNGPESPGDAVRAASLASRFLGDVNHRTTHWIHFIGFEVPDPRDDATRIIAYAPTSPMRVTQFLKYYYYQQLAEAFDVGAVFREASSSAGRDMAWTYGKKPRLSAAAARNPDGGWAVGLSNFTAAAFADNPDDNGGYKARAFDVTVSIPELAGKGDVSFGIRRSGGRLTNAAEESVTMRGGKLTVPVGLLELVTLRSAAAGK